ncbi:MAG: DegT/DnrJ/EryC1/StrS family aminotransferase [Lentisphaerota bacterium]
MKNSLIYVTQPSLPALEELEPYLKDIWDRKCLTNNGHYHQLFEEALCEYLGVKYVSLFCNGTIAILAGLKALNIAGEVITTPFTFVATTHSLKWSGITPVFCDIEQNTCNIDSDKIENLITENTKAILPVHVYGNPCNVEKIRCIADKYNLKVFYDAAHAFGVKYKEQPIGCFGNITMLSFHATKIFNTFEGGALVTNDSELKNKIDKIKNFAFENETTISGLGINGKMNEFQAALGFIQLKYIDAYIAKNKKIAEIYRNGLEDIPGIRFLDNIEYARLNYSYFPIFVDAKLYGINRDELYSKLKGYSIHTRRYFFPLISNLKIYNDLPSSRIGNLPVANKISEEVLCLPIYPDLCLTEVDRILKIISANMGRL